MPERTSATVRRRRRTTTGKRIHVIINPAAGQDRPVLGILNRVFQPAGIEWEVFVTRRAGDAGAYARRAAAAGVDAVAVYGGDGTIMEAASGLIGTDVPLAIFPGGTANVLSVELGIPGDLAEACALAFDDTGTIRCIDVGKVDGRWFLLRVGVGFEAQMIEGADRELKSRLGILAYGLSALQALREPKLSHYRLTIDGRQMDAEGITCMIANAGSLGRSGVSLAAGIDPGDGLLDAVIVRKADLPSLLAVAASVATGREEAELLLHYQGRDIEVAAEPVQDVQADGEMLGQTPVRAVVVPKAVRVIVPPTATLVSPA